MKQICEKMPNEMVETVELSSIRDLLAGFVVVVFSHAIFSGKKESGVGQIHTFHQIRVNRVRSKVTSSDLP